MMRYTIRKCYFLENEEAISEELTTLPALSIVMIGLTLFIVLIAQTYVVYADRVDRLQRYQTVDGLTLRLTNPNCFFIREGGLMDITLLMSDTTTLQHFFDSYTRMGYSYLFQLHWDNHSWFFPDMVASVPGNRIAMSKQIGVYLNEAQTIPGTMTISLWKGS